MSTHATRPFHSGTQYEAWESRNCNRCSKGATVGGDDWPTCPMQEASLIAYIGDGTITDNLAARMGYDDDHHNAFTWDCPERVLR